MWARVLVSICALSLTGCHLIFPFNGEQEAAEVDAAPETDGAPDAPPERDGTVDAPTSDSFTPVAEPEVLWASQTTGTSSHQCLASDVVSDADGKTYVVGHFAGTVKFSPSTTLSNTGGVTGTDAFMAGYDENGTNLWAKRLGGTAGTDMDAALGVALAPNGDLLVTGYVSGKVTFATKTPTSYGKKDAFVARLSSGGTPKWIARIGGAEDDKGQEVVVTSTGKVHVAGSSTGAIDSDVFSASGYGKGDGFLATFKDSGQTTDLLTFGGADADRYSAVAVDSNGALVVAGEYTGALKVGSSGTTTTFYGDQDLLVTKYKATLPSLVVSMGSTALDSAHGLTLGALDTIYIVGDISDRANLGSGLMGQPGTKNGYLAKRQSNGMNSWARATEAGKSASFLGLALDSKGRPCVAGFYEGSVTIQGNARTAKGQWDILVAGFGTGGNLHWMASYGGAKLDMGWGVSADTKGHVYVTGHFQQDVIFGKHPLSASGTSSDLFLIKLKPPAAAP